MGESRGSGKRERRKKIIRSSTMSYHTYMKRRRRIDTRM
jgi:hypothetical protein